MRPESLAAHFVNDLFPAAQGVVDSPAVSHCMRFAIEMARVSAITILTATEATKEIILAGLSSTMRQWRQKCASQIDLLGICVMSKALDTRRGRYSSGDPAHCPFRLIALPDRQAIFQNNDGYMTPGCLVYIYGKNGKQPTVHDPCQYHDCTGPNPISLDVSSHIMDIEQTQLSFNPLSMVDPLEVRGTWSKTAPHNMSQTLYDDFLSKVDIWHNDLTRDMPGRLVDMSLFKRALLNEEGLGAGSPNHRTTAGRTAPLKSATEDDTKYFDMMMVGLFNYYAKKPK